MLAAPALPLRTIASITLPGGASRLDYASVDVRRHRLYIAHLGGGLVIVFDTKTRRVVKTIPAPGAHGVLAVPALDRVYATATDSRELLTIDEHTLKVIARAPAGEYPDGIAWDPDHQHIYVSDETGGIVSVFTVAGHRVATIRLGGEAGNVQYDPGSKHVLVDVQTGNAVAIINPRTERVIRRVAMPGSCVHPHGLLIDAPRRLAFVACDGNATLLTIDLDTMKVIGRTSVGDGPDVLALDTSLHRLYVASESGIVSAFAEHARGVTKLGQALLAPEAHVVAVDSSTHLVYFPLQSQPELRVMKPTR